MSDLKFIDCNGLAGFLSLGFVQAGYEMVHRTGTLDFGNAMVAANTHLVGDGWQGQFSDDPHDWHKIRDVDVVAGLPPCSSWSCWTGPANRGKDAKAIKHTWALVTYAGRIAPKAVVYESVQQAFSQGRETMQGMRAELESVSGKQYDLHHVKMNNLMIGGKSYRPRYFWVALEKGLAFGTRSQTPEAVPGIMDVIGDLQDAEDTWDHQPYRAETSPWIAKQVSASGGYDGHKEKDNIHSDRIKDIFAALHKHGEDWNWGEGLSRALQRVYELQGHLPESWSVQSEKIIKRNFDMGFSLPYRWPGDQWANVLTGGALNMVVHPTRPRCITHREAARIQGLPDDWVIKPVREYTPMQDAWGKAVSVDAGRWIGQQIQSSLAGDPGEPGELIGDREWLHATDKGFSRQFARKRYFPESKGGITKVYDSERWPSAQAV
jgi:site-specific DNA-cytosine methylase